MRKNSPFKKCPRCKEKCLVHEKACHECGLIFERLNYTSNKVAKKLILKGKYKDTIKTADWPYDAKKSTALWLSGLFGFCGAHNFYLGRFIKGAISLFGIVLSIIMVALNDVIYGTNVWTYLNWIVLIPGACSLIFWITDFISIFFEKYKIPVAVDEKLLYAKNNPLNDKKPVEELNFNKNNKKLGKKVKKNNKKVKKTENTEIGE